MPKKPAKPRKSKRSAKKTPKTIVQVNNITLWRESVKMANGRKLTQEVLAHEAGMSTSNLSLIETGVIDVVGDSLNRIAAALRARGLNVSGWDLVYREPGDKLGELTSAAAGLPEEQLDALTVMAKTLRPKPL